MKSKEFIEEAFTNPYPLKNLNNNVQFDLTDTRKFSGAQADWTTVDGVKYRAHAFRIGLTKAQRDKKAQAKKARADKIARGERPQRTIPRLGGVANANGGIWEVHFDAEYETPQSTAIFKDTIRTSDVTGTGDAFRVFATMFEFIKYIVRQAKPDIISIKSETDHDSRVKLYDTLAKRYAGKLGYEVVKKVVGPVLTRIELRKKNEK